MAVILRVFAGLAAIIAIGGSAFAENAPTASTSDLLRTADVVADAHHDFWQIDRDADGLVDADEFASARLVHAQLARLSGRVAMDAATTLNVKLPMDVPRTMEKAERAALEGVARRDYALHAMGHEGLTEHAFAESRLELFFTADGDRDGVLRGDELERFARLIAGQLSAGFPAS